MTRTCVKYPTDDFKEGVPQLLGSSVELYIDVSNAADILEIINSKKKKFNRILFEVLSNRYNDDLYGKENVTQKSKDVTAMKFKGSDNVRIICKEFHMNGKLIVMALAVSKKTQKVNKKLKTVLETVGGYEYEFQD